MRYTLLTLLLTACSWAASTTADYVSVVSGQIVNISSSTIQSVQISEYTPTGRRMTGVRGPLNWLPGAVLPQVFAQNAVIDSLVLDDGTVIGDEQSVMVRRIRGMASARLALESLDGAALQKQAAKEESIAGMDTDWSDLFLTRLAKEKLAAAPTIDAASSPEVNAPPIPVMVETLSCRPATVQMGNYSSCTFTLNQVLRKTTSFVTGSDSPYARPVVNTVSVPAGINAGSFSVLTYTLQDGVDQVLATISLFGPNNGVQTTILVKRDNSGVITSVHLHGTTGQCPDYFNLPPYEGLGCTATKTDPAPEGYTQMVYASMAGFCSPGSAVTQVSVYPESWHTCSTPVFIQIRVGLLAEFRGVWSEASASAVNPPIDGRTSAFADCLGNTYAEPSFDYVCGSYNP